MFVNMVTSADGQTTLGGKASKIGSDVDRHTMRNLRANSDAVLVGANTLRAERLSLGLSETASGPQPPEQPLAVILATTGDVPLQTNLVYHEDQSVLVIASGAISEEDLAEGSRGAKVLRVPAASDGRPDLMRALQALKKDYAVERLLVEGGPTLNWALISAGLVDELYLTVAPKLLGGIAQKSSTILDGALETTVELRLLSVHLASNELFLRYAISSGDGREETP